jgi:hypothetical protein
MGKVTLAKQRAIGAIGPARVARLEAAGLRIVDAAEDDKAIQRRKELERELARLKREAAPALVGEIK